MKKRLLYLIAGIALAGAATGVSFATGTAATASVTINAGTSGGIATVSQWASGDGGNVTSAPSWAPVAQSSGTVTQAGNIYTVKPNTTGDMLLTIYLNNGSQLSGAYSYLNLQVAVYEGTPGGTFTQATDLATNTTASQYLSLNTGYVTFDLGSLTSPNTEYVVEISGGSFYCTSTSVSADLQPSFYASVEPTA